MCIIREKSITSVSNDESNNPLFGGGGGGGGSHTYTHISQYICICIYMDTNTDHITPAYGYSDDSG